MDATSILKIITNSTLLATRLLSGHPPDKIHFSSKQYCCLVFEDAPVTTTVIRVKATHSEGKPFMYSIIRGNEGGLFSVDVIRGEISIAAPLDHELVSKHTLVISADSSDGESCQTTVHIRVADINDNAPTFEVTDLKVEVIEEDHLGLPHDLGRVWARDRDWVDRNELLYTLIGDGVDGFSPEDAFFAIHPRSGVVTQLRPLDRDPPNGKAVWKLRVKVHDGQSEWATTRIDAFTKSKHHLVRSLTSVSSHTTEGGDDKVRNKGIHKRKRSVSPKSGEAIETNKTDERCCFDDDESLKKIPSTTPRDNEAEKINEKLSAKKKNQLNRKIGGIRTKYFIKNKKVKSLTTRFETLIKQNFIQQTNSMEMRIKNKYKRNISGVTNYNFHEFNSNVLNNEQFSPMAKCFCINFIAMQRFQMRKQNKNYFANKYPKLKQNKNKQLNKNKVIPPFKCSFASSRYTNILKKSENYKKYLSVQDKSATYLANAWSYLEDIRITNKSKRTFKKYIKHFEMLNTGWKKNRTKASKKTLQNENRVRRAIINNPGSIRHIRESVASESDNCDLFGSLTSPLNQEQRARLKHSVYKLKSSRDYHRKPNFHVVETGLTIIVKDINDNPPIFPNTTIYAEVQENGPVDLPVAMVTAWDADDPHSPTNAVLRYYLEKNAVDERNGSPVFKINASTGEIKTAHCCLDRESTLEYQLQVVAADGGGLKGTGTVAVLLTDVNDNSPRFARREWKVVINETQGTALPDNATLFEISVNDLDTSNNFLFRVVESSGWGWEFFGIRASGPVGEVFAVKPLDYENKQQRRGIRFLVQVTDKGSWPDYPDSRVESAWVEVRLRDVNDNPPVFQRRFIHVTLKEDAPPGTFVEKVTVIDPDQDGENSVALKLMDDWADLEINDGGEIRTTIPLDRESPTGSRGIVRILAIDHGMPRLSSTATIVVMVTDVNDCPPRILGPKVFHVKENSEPKRIGIILATDDDDWGLGHGPPFTFSLADLNPSYLSKLLEFRFLKGLDSGRGGAELFTKVPLDREKYRQIVVKVTIHDAANVTSVNNIIVNVDDVNDNDMKPAHKTIYIWKTQNAQGNNTIGKVFVEDPDDADGKDKRFTWAEEHSSKLFSLDESSGEIQVSSHIPQGRYQMRFKVSDFFRRQVNVDANVTVHVKVIDENSLSHALAITLFPVTPSALIKDWVPNTTSGGLGKLTSTLKNVLNSENLKLDIISVSNGRRPAQHFVPNTWFSSSTGSFETTSSLDDLENEVINPSTTVWITALDSERKFVETYKLRGLLEMKIKEIESAMSLNVDFEDEEIEMLPNHRFSLSKLSDFKPQKVLPLWSSSTDMSFIPEDYFSFNISHSQISPTEFKKRDRFFLQVVDANATALVTPLIRRVLFCSSKEFQTIDNTSKKRQMPPHCETLSCLNGGRCIPTSWGSKCICPGGTQGRSCKLTSMNIFPGGFSWIDPLPPCFPLTVSIQFAASHPHGILLYSGPLSERASSNSFLEPNESRKTISSPLFVLQLSQGRLQLIIEGILGGYKLEISPLNSFSDGRWHHVYILLDHNGASVMSDFCAKGENRTRAINNCYANTRWRRKSQARKYPWKVPWQVSLPLQVGGLAQAPPKRQAHGWANEIVENSFEGCIDHLRVNEKLMDMGRTSLREGIQTGRCRLHETLCSASCSPRGTCLNEEDRYLCSCPAGFQGATCENRTTSAIFYSNRVKKISLDFDTNPYETRLQLRFKTHARNISILRLRSRNDTFLNLRVQEGYLCLIYEQQWTEGSKQFPFEMLKKNFSIPSAYEKEISSQTIQLKIQEMNTQMKNSLNQPLQNNLENSRSKDDLRLCLMNIICSDGLWHDVRGGKFGQNLLLEVDDGDEGERNYLFHSLQDNHRQFIPIEFVLQRSEGVILGNDSTEEISFAYDTDNGSKICIDDLRLFGRPISLSKSNRRSSSSKKRIKKGNRTTSCTLSDVCEDSKCDSLTSSCKRLRNYDLCGCPRGQTPTTNGCQAYDLCFYRPCLHGGSCSRAGNEDPFCTCLPTFSGDFCQWQSRQESGYEFDIPLVAVVATLFFFILAMAGRLLWWCARRKRRNRNLRSRNLSSGGPEVAYHSKHIPPSRCLRDVENSEQSKINIEVINLPENRDSEEIQVELWTIKSLSKKIEDSLRKTKRVNNFSQDDLRAYAYEGDGSSSVSLGSASAALRDECKGSTEILPLTTTIKDTVDLLKDLLDRPLDTSIPRHKNSPMILESKQTSSLPKDSTVQEKPKSIMKVSAPPLKN